MAWRLQFTIATLHDTDFVFNLYDIGLISLLELWLGVIAACIPTLGPLLKSYVKPALTKLTSPSDRATRSQSGNASKVDSKTGLHSKKHYSQIEDGFDSGFNQLNGMELASVTTKIESGPGTKAMTDTRGVIYVQHEIEAK